MEFYGMPHQHSADDSMRVFLDEVRRLDFKAKIEKKEGVSVTITWSDGTPLFVKWSYIRETKENVRQLARKLFKHTSLG